MCFITIMLLQRILSKITVFRTIPENSEDESHLLQPITTRLIFIPIGTAPGCAYFSPNPMWYGKGFLVALHAIVHFFNSLEKNILGVVYNTTSLEINDFQIGISGRVEEGESPGEAVIREAMEEMGLELSLEQLVLVHVGVDNLPTKDSIWTYVVDLDEESDPVMMTRSLCGPPPSTVPYRVQLFVYGSHESVSLAMIKGSSTVIPNDNICGVGSLPISSITDGHSLFVTTTYNKTQTDHKCPLIEPF